MKPTVRNYGDSTNKACLTQLQRCRHKWSKKLLALEFVEMSGLQADMWPEEPLTADRGGNSRCPSKPPVTLLRTWLECYSRMAAVIASRFPEKAGELAAYQTTIIHAAYTYEGANWVAYDPLYRREILAAKNLNWSVPNQRLHSEAFTGRAKKCLLCPQCLSKDHAAVACPHNPNPPIDGWLQGSPYVPVESVMSVQPGSMLPPKKTVHSEVCRYFNGNHCHLTRCRYLYICSDCAGQHPATLCPSRQSPLS